MTIRLRDVEIGDLALLLAWRNHPMVYQGFYEQGYLNKGYITWEEHFAFWTKHLSFIKDKEDVKWRAWVIRCNSRDVGLVWLSDLDKPIPEVGIYVGEITLYGQGVGKEALTATLKKLKILKRKKVRAKIIKDNNKSVRLFTSCGFKMIGEAREGEWLYEYNI